MNDTLIRRIIIAVIVLILMIGFFAVRPARSSADGGGEPDPETGCILVQDEYGNWYEDCPDLPNGDGLPCTKNCE